MQKLGEILIIQEVGYIPNAEYVVDVAKRYGVKYILPVLPLSFVARLAELAPQHGFVILWSKMKTLATTTKEEAERLVNEKWDCRTAVCNGEKCRVFEFEVIEKLKAIHIETEPL